ncbi:YbjN domain-containing protein [Corynebacterium freiburgense]|uniref:YbjN domain-containing protein n=1 Tax=Corynebacterium freiburgense TaxID=556548 RepID=UPI00041253B2|nr:YbjN domain-containing protein [Corynebacterium freiburgense]WJZ03007.1 hypothetical protein CFREI_08645 [Corynebacterium freiburgense]
MALPAVTVHRIKALLKQQELEFDSNDDEVFVRFDNATFGFQWIDEINILRIVGFWRGITSEPATVSKLIKHVEAKNSELFLPKLNTFFSEDGNFRVAFEYCASAGTGLTDAQLQNIMFAVFSAGFSVLEEMEKIVPELVAWDTDDSSDETSESDGEEA